MRWTMTGIAAAVLLALAAPGAQAQWFPGPPPSPYACNSPYITTGPNGQCCMPIYQFRGPCLPPPFNGMLPTPQPRGAAGGGGLQFANFATHPFAHGPRDFFMYGQQYND